jgi:hypothetical protein
MCDLEVNGKGKFVAITRTEVEFMKFISESINLDVQYRTALLEDVYHVSVSVSETGTFEGAVEDMRSFSEILQL